ncbi:hypothetical protein [Micromonospora sp. NPDC005237]|uniref:hypothetical protein n=1 Tax=Micromonospora sp. NPDC005237 TaxID=3155113 RepID=UPI0033B1EED5
MPAGNDTAQHGATGEAEPARTSPTEPPLPADDESDAGDQRYGARVINKFYGQVHAAQATFGVSGGTMATPALVGRLRSADVDQALRYYVPPAGYDTAQDTLSASHLLVLAGEEGSGRRASAFALLQAMTTGQMTGLSPAMTLAQLADYDYVPDRGYVVLDWLGERRDGAVQAFDVGRLSHRLKKAGAFLVVTSEPRPTLRRELPGHVVTWQSPDPTAIVDAYLGKEAVSPLSPEDAERIRQRVTELGRPAEVVRLLERLSRGVEAALDEAERTAQRRVEEWFGETTSWAELLTVAALAFAYELPERTFEELHARLRQVDREEGLQPETAVAAQAPSPSGFQGRRGLHRDGGLITRREGTTLDIGLGDERRLVFVAASMREHVLRELYECDYRLWRPLRVWMHELAAVPDLDTRLQLALGVTLLARNRSAAGEARDLLRIWAAGRAAERFTAVATVSFMAGDDVLAPVALRTVLDWSEGKGQNCAVTAAMALGGPLGIRYPTEAVRWLWHLSTRGKPVRVVAARSLGLLLCATEGDLQGAEALLKRLLVRLRHTLHGAVELRLRGHAIESVLEVLTVRHLDRDEPMVAYLLRERPQVTSTVGALWAEVLRSLPHRGAGIDALRATLDAAANEPAVSGAVGRLGDAIRDELTPEECVLLRRDLAWALRHPFDDAGTHRPVVTALLAALAGTPARALSH